MLSSGTPQLATLRSGLYSQKNRDRLKSSKVSGYSSVRAEEEEGRRGEDEEEEEEEEAAGGSDGAVNAADGMRRHFMHRGCSHCIQ